MGLTRAERRASRLVAQLALADGLAKQAFLVAVEAIEDDTDTARLNADGKGFAAFGRVVKGMDVVRAIHALPAEKQRLKEQVEITQIRRADE